MCFSPSYSNSSLPRARMNQLTAATHQVSVLSGVSTTCVRVEYKISDPGLSRAVPSPEARSWRSPVSRFHDHQQTYNDREEFRSNKTPSLTISCDMHPDPPNRVRAANCRRFGRNKPPGRYFPAFIYILSSPAPIALCPCVNQSSICHIKRCHSS